MSAYKAFASAVVIDREQSRSTTRRSTFSWPGSSPRRLIACAGKSENAQRPLTCISSIQSEQSPAACNILSVSTSSLSPGVTANEMSRAIDGKRDTAVQASDHASAPALARSDRAASEYPGCLRAALSGDPAPSPAPARHDAAGLFQALQQRSRNTTALQHFDWSASFNTFTSIPPSV